MKVTTAELRKAFEKVIAEFEMHDASEWDVHVDAYWDVPSDQRYLPYETPGRLSMGLLADDIARVRAIAEGRDEPVPMGLVWLASILRLAGERGIIGMKSGAQ